MHSPPPPNSPASGPESRPPDEQGWRHCPLVQRSVAVAVAVATVHHPPAALVTRIQCAGTAVFAIRPALHHAVGQAVIQRITIDACLLTYPLLIVMSHLVAGIGTV